MTWLNSSHRKKSGINRFRSEKDFFAAKRGEEVVVNNPEWETKGPLTDETTKDVAVGLTGATGEAVDTGLDVLGLGGILD